jgi:hypothetical protein
MDRQDFLPLKGLSGGLKGFKRFDYSSARFPASAFREVFRH